MLENSKTRLVISFILAFALWFYVVGQMNPPMRKTYRDIAITLTNEQSLSDNGLSVLNWSDDSLRVTVSGKRSTINKLSKADIVATEGDARSGLQAQRRTVRIDDDVVLEQDVAHEIRIVRTRLPRYLLHQHRGEDGMRVGVEARLQKGGAYQHGHP